MAIRTQKEQDWLKKHLTRLTSLDPALEVFLENNCKIFNDYGAWTALKLIFLTYVIDIYTLIISKQKQSWCKRMCYIDLLAGAGVTKIRETDDLVVGSPLIALILPKDKFDTLFLCETNDEKIKALNRGFQNLKDKGFYNDTKTEIKVIPKSCNQGIDEILSDIKKNEHFLAFVDCESGLEVSCETLTKLLKAGGDLIVNFQTTNLIRTIALAKKEGKGAEKLNSFFGNDCWKSIKDENELLKTFIKKIEEYDKLVETVEIKGPGGFHYHLIFICRKTKSGSGWFKGIVQGKNQVEKHGAKSVQEMLDILKGRQKTLAGIF